MADPTRLYFNDQIAVCQSFTTSVFNTLLSQLTYFPAAAATICFTFCFVPCTTFSSS